MGQCPVRHSQTKGHLGLAVEGANIEGEGGATGNDRLGSLPK